MMKKLASIEDRYNRIEELLADPDVSVNYTRVQELSKELASIKDLATLSQKHRQIIIDLEEVQKITRDESDKEMAALAREEITELEEKRIAIDQKIKLALVSKDPNDEKNVIVEVRAGAGGEEAGLFAAGLYRMYQRYAQRKGWAVEVMNSTETGLGAFKEIVFMVKGKGAFSRLKHESGGHRVQRVPITESSGRIHTSAATVAVLPEAEEVDVNISTDDLQIDIFHSSGHGGQNVQKVATAVRITHKPTGVVAICQDERSQFKNKEKAMSVLRSRVLARRIDRQQQAIEKDRRNQVGSGDRSDRVRTYNFPQDRVTDHRTSLTTHNLAQVLDGDIDQFIDSMIDIEQARKLGEAGM